AKSTPTAKALPQGMLRTQRIKDSGGQEKFCWWREGSRTLFFVTFSMLQSQSDQRNLLVFTEQAMATPATGQSLSASSPADLEWTKLLWEEWKYRHDNFWNKFYRAVWAVVVCAAAPWIKLEKIGVDLFSQ